MFWLSVLLITNIGTNLNQYFIVLVLRNTFVSSNKTLKTKKDERTNNYHSMHRNSIDLACARELPLEPHKTKHLRP